MIVVDASLMLDIGLATPDAQNLKQRVDEVGAPIGAPDILVLEVLQTLRRLLYTSVIDLPAAERALRILRHFDVNYFAHAPLTDRIWELRNNLTAYDAAYFALAEQLGAELWTRDLKFTGLSNHDAVIRLL